MGLFDKLTTIVRGKARETVESIEDANAGTILDQHYVDEKERLKKLKIEVASLRTEHKVQERKLESAEKECLDATTAATTYLENGDEENGLKLIARLEDVLTPNRDALVTRVAGLAKNVENAKKAVSKIERQIDSMGSQIAEVKTQKRINDISANLSSVGTAGAEKSERANDALERFKERTERQTLNLESGQELFGEDNEDSTANLIANAGKKTNLSAAERLAALKK